MPAVAAFKQPQRQQNKKKVQKNELGIPITELPHLCPVCGGTYPRQPGYFPKIPTRMYKGNNYYSAICNTCCTEYYQNWLKEYKDEKKAIRRCCEWLNIYYDPIAVGRAGGGLLGYMDDMDKNARGFGGKSWDDTIAEEAYAAEKEEAARAAQAQECVVEQPVRAETEARRPDVIEGENIFGEGFPDDAYSFMLRTYHGYIDPLGDTVTAVQVKSARFLAALEYRCMEAIKADKSNASALSSSLTRAIKESGFDTIQEQSSANDEDTFGQWLEKIEAYTPAQYVKQTPYKDVDNYGEYYDRFVRRPIENLLNRASQMQSDELAITDEEADAVDVNDDDEA